MNQRYSHHSYLPFVLLACALLGAGLACSLLNPNSQTPTAGATGSTALPGSSAGKTPAVPGAQAGLRGPGDYDLSDPSAGLNDLESYTQNLIYTVSATLKGQPYTAKTSIQRTVFTAGPALGVLESESSAGQNIYRAALTENGATYVQQAAGQACRASQNPARAGSVPDPALRLPPVFGAEPAGRETLEGIPAIHYTFDERAVRYAAGQNGTASGELWVAEGGQLVLKYILTVESKEGDVPGTQTWEYSLDSVNMAEAVSLPAGCLALPLDLPILPGAKDVLLRPGFTRFTSDLPLVDAVKFYRDEMLNAAWQETPVDEEAEGPLALTFTRPEGSGSRLAAVRFEEAGSSLQVVIQLIQLKNPLVIDAQSMPGAPDGSQATGIPPLAVATPGSLPGKLPEDLPLYPNAGELLNTEAVMMFTTPDSVQQVGDFYDQALKDLGWELSDKNDMAGMVTQTWTKDGASLMMMISRQDNKTQVVITIS